ncbi:MAG: hypothetical protein K2P78_08860 [Gemmataceae bacterium]|nr:hypothetical protein [Gemmataceae bacterium]
MGFGLARVVAALAGNPGGAVALREEVTIKVVAVAGDPFGPEADRRKAIHALGVLGTPAALDFLADNITLQFPVPFEFESRPGRITLPCDYALTHEGQGKPRRGQAVVLAVLGALDKSRDSGELSGYTIALYTALSGEPGNGVAGYDRARALIVAELGKKPAEERKRNLDGILFRLDQWLGPRK